MDTMREEIGRICDQDNQATLDLGEPPDICEFEKQRSSHANNNTDKHTAKEDEQEDTGTLQEAEETIVCCLALVIPLRGFENDNSDGIVKD